MEPGYSTTAKPGSLSTHALNRRKPEEQFDRSGYSAGQSLVTVINDPRADSSHGRWLWSTRPDTRWQDPPPPLDPIKYPSITKKDMQQYLKIVNGNFKDFLLDRQSLLEMRNAQLSSTSSQGGQGDGLVQAMATVPHMYFQEDFSLSRPEIFQVVCESRDDAALQDRIEGLSSYLDTVETQLMSEVATRSHSIFEAAGGLRELHHTLSTAQDHVRDMRCAVAEMDESTYAAAAHVCRLTRRRKNLLAALEATKGLEEVCAARAALQCLLEQEDYGGALELLDNIRHMAEGAIGSGITLMRRVMSQVDENIGVVETLLVTEFENISIYRDVEELVERIIAEAISERINSPTAESNAEESVSTNFTGDASESGPLRSSLDPSSPSRIAASPSGRNALWEMAGPASEQLHDKLLPLVAGLVRCGRLEGALHTHRDAACTEMKLAVRRVVESLVAILTEQREGGEQDSRGNTLQENLELLDHRSFMSLLKAVKSVVGALMAHASMLTTITEEVAREGRLGEGGDVAATKKALSSLHEGLAEVASSRWVRLIGCRTQIAARLRLAELAELLQLTESFGKVLEAAGARPPATLQTAVQAQCKSFLEALHTKATTQLTHLLESEQWSAVEVTPDMRAIVDRLLERCSGMGDSLTRDGHHISPNDKFTSSANGRSRNHSMELSTSGSGTAALEAMTSGPVANGNHAHHEPSVAQEASTSGREHGRPGSSTGGGEGMLVLGGRSFPVVGSALMLLKLVDEYLGMAAAVPAFSVDVASRTLEVLREFNRQTADLVLGAGALKTAGLKSISAKHLALTCQSIHMISVLLPMLRTALGRLLAPSRRALMVHEFDHLQHDLEVHMNEIYTKFVEIMRERLGSLQRALVQDAEHWGSGSVKDPSPGEPVKVLMKQLTVLRSILAPNMQPDELQVVFGRVATLFSDTLATTLDSLGPGGGAAAWEAARRCNTEALLTALGALPLDPATGSAQISRLTTFYSKHYGALPQSFGMHVSPAPLPAQPSAS